MSQKAVITYAELNSAINIAWQQAEKRGINTSMLDGIEEYLSDHVGSINVEIDRLGHILLDEDLADRSLEDIIESLAVQDDSQVDTVLHAIKLKGLTYGEAIRQVNAYYCGTESGSHEERLASLTEDALRDQLIDAKGKVRYLTIDQVNSLC